MFHAVKFFYNDSQVWFLLYIKIGIVPKDSAKIYISRTDPVCTGDHLTKTQEWLTFNCWMLTIHKSYQEILEGNATCHLFTFFMLLITCFYEFEMRPVIV